MTVLAVAAFVAGVVLAGIGYFRYPSNESLREKIRNHETIAAEELRVKLDRDDKIRENLYVAAVICVIVSLFISTLLTLL